MLSLCRSLLVVCILACVLPSQPVVLVRAWVEGDTVPISYQLKINGSISNAGAWATLPLDFVPRFGINKHVTIPSLDYGSSEPHVSIRFRLDRGLDKLTKWMTVKRTIPIAVSVNPKAMKEAHLNKVTFQFGYQTGVFDRFSSMKVLAQFSEKPVPTIAIEYQWSEHRRFNPHRAITVLYVLSLGVTALLVHRLLGASILPASANGTPSRLVVIDARSE